MVERLSQPEAGSSPLAFATEYAQPLWRQYLIILAKNMVCYWRCVAGTITDHAALGAVVCWHRWPDRAWNRLTSAPRLHGRAGACVQG